MSWLVDASAEWANPSASVQMFQDSLRSLSLSFLFLKKGLPDRRITRRLKTQEIATAFWSVKETRRRFFVFV
jgi:hypothetical protein